jgi:hypothetical protein
MELINATGMQAGYTLGMEPSGREHLVVVVKGTFTIPEDGGEPELAEEQVPSVQVAAGSPDRVHRPELRASASPNRDRRTRYRSRSGPLLATEPRGAATAKRSRGSGIRGSAATDRR